MSDCRNGGRFTPHWTDQVWHSPSGRAIHAPEGEELHEVAVIAADGEARYYHYAGADAVRVTVDGTRHFTEDGVDLVEHYGEGRVQAVDVDGVRFVRADS